MTGPERIRVLYVINDLGRAGAETQLVGLVRRLDRAAFEPRVVLLKTRNDFAEELARAGVPVVALGRRGWWDLAVVWRLSREVSRFRPHVVHAWLFLANLVSALAVRGPARRLVLSQRCSYDATAGPALRSLARWSHRRADCVTVNSRAALEEEMAAGYGRVRLVHIPNGVEAIQPSAAAPGLPRGPLVVSVGQLARIKGHHVLLQAWRRILEHAPQAHLVLVGAGPEQHRLEQQARTLGLDGSVTFAGFRAPTSPYMAGATVCVQPSLTEGMPNAVLEAMAVGRPVVASAVGGVPELIEHEVTGLLVPANDPEALATAVTGLLADGAKAARLGQAARARAAERFSFERVLAETVALYRSLTTGAGPAANASTPAAISTGPTVTP